MTRRKSVRRAPEGRDEEREQDDAGREVAALDQRLEATAAVVRAARPSMRRWRPRDLTPSANVRTGRGHVEWRAEQVGRIGAQRVALAGRPAPTDASTRAPSRAATVISRQPIRRSKLVSRNPSRLPLPSARIHRVEAERLRPPAPGRRQRDARGHERARRPSRGARASSPRPPRSRERFDSAAVLERRDLCQVEDVVDVRRGRPRARSPRSG